MKEAKALSGSSPRMTTIIVHEESAGEQRQTFFIPLLLMALSWAVVALLSFFAVMELKAPKPVPATAAANEFSAERAMLHVNQIARAPHPLGSANAGAVREYLIAQLSALGLNPQVFPAIGVHKNGRNVVVGSTHDIIGRLPGSSSSKAVMLMAHYDSVDTAPGAADDGAAVAAILEAVRALRNGSPALKNDLIVLFTDGEEAGLLGAEAFASSHPWAKDVGIVLNFEARGDRGPSMLFETSGNNRPLIEAFAKADSHPIASSLFYSLYKLLPNDTDLTVFRPLGVPGLNFAFGENLQSYHSTLDTPQNFSPASLQHHGDHALSLAREFGHTDLNHLRKGGDDVFFNWFGGGLVHYGQIWVIPGELIVTALLLLLVLLGVRKAEVRLNRILLALLPCLALVIAIPSMMALTGWLIFRLLGGHMLLTDSPANAYLLAGLVLAGTCSGLLLFKAFSRRFSPQELSFSGLLLLGVINWAVTLLLPAGSYLVFWPLLSALVAMLAINVAGKWHGESLQWLAGFAGLVSSVLLFAPLAYLLYIFLTLQWLTVAAIGLLLSFGFLASSFSLNAMMPRRGSRPL
ncbi:MAG TPA: M20/M25/M40 family metallo-hydrolase, partial [Candidatus Angelobacter sp.]|nr:M20/M25/M40 family metallo-hydrolase [Candidatus Angelobacter sp.]